MFTRAPLIREGVRHVPPQSERRRITSKDVALAAGVSRTTVSFVLNERADVAIPDSTRQRVWAAASKLGYAPSPEARALRLGRSDVVLCLLPDWPITGPVGVLLEALSAELALAGLTMLSHQRQAADELGQVLAALTPTAIVTMCDLAEVEVELAEQRGIQVVSFMGRVPKQVDVACFTQADVGRLQVRAVVADRGHSFIGYVSPYDRKLDWFSAPRLAGARQEARQLGARLIHYRLPARDNGSTGKWLETARAKGMTAVCAYNDDVAFSLLMAAFERGLSVPDDLSLIGVDDSAFTTLTRPTLSSIGFRLGPEAKRLTAVILGDGQGVHPGSPSDVFDLKVRDSLAMRRPVG